MRYLFIISFFSLLFFSSFSGDNYKLEKHVGLVIPEFSLRSTDGTVFNFTNNPNAKGYIVVFICNHCPFAKLYPERLNALNTKYNSLGIPLIAINSMDTAVYEEESFENMILKSRSEHFNFPYLYDVQQRVGKLFKADHTPHAFIVWKENGNWVVKYSGAIDDNGEHPELANSYLEPAINSLLNNQVIQIPETNSFGCRIYYRK